MQTIQKKTLHRFPSFSIVLTLALIFSFFSVDLTAAQEQRPRTLLDMLFGSRKAEPQPQIKKIPRRTRPSKPRKVPKAKPAAQPAPILEVPTTVEKKDDAKKILIVGDFIGNGLAEGLEAAFAADADIRFINQTNGSSGFVRDDHYNWPANIGKLLDEQKPFAVVVMIGANDRQAINTEGNALPPRTPEWNAAYAKRLEAFINKLSNRSLPIVWIGQPSYRVQGMAQDMLALNEIYKTSVEKAHGTYVDVWEGFVDENGNFTQTGFDINGQTARLRANDGINITAAGKRKLAFYAEKPLRALLGEPLPDADISPVATTPDPLKPTDRIAPMNLRDVGRDDSGVLLGGSSPQLAKRPASGVVSPAQPNAGRADNFNLPTSEAKP